MSRLGYPRALAATLAVAAVLCLHARPVAQDQPVADRLRALLSDAQKAYGDRRLDDAARSFQAIVDLGESEHDELWVARGRLGLGGVAYHRGDYPGARAQLALAAPVFERLNAAYELG
ncbi:MAG TPA: hypothetical protein VLT86_19410, partial [Vicinamibacterales bacterium]|nr:hypothetical protein [Vicinamibacterales bacterium]